MKKTFEEKVKSMSAAQIIRAMIRGLKKEHVKVDMGSFGHRQRKQCFGCAATNTVCELAGLPIPKTGIFTADYGENEPWDEMAAFVKASSQFLRTFECAIDCLRCGELVSYNEYADEAGFAQIKDADFELPELTNSDYLEGLPAYEKLARAQIK